MIKTPVSKDRFPAPNSNLFGLQDAISHIGYPFVEEEADQIIAALNAQPKAQKRIEELEPLIEACQGAVIIVNEIVRIMDDFVAAKQLEPFPHPPLDGIKKAITKAGATVYETAKEAKTALDLRRSHD